MATSPPVALDDPGREFSEARLLVFHLLPRAGERAHQIRGANCVQSTLNGTVTQVLSLPAAYSAANPCWLSMRLTHQ